MKINYQHNNILIVIILCRHILPVSVSGDRFLAELGFSVDTSLAVLFTIPVPTALSESDGYTTQ